MKRKSKTIETLSAEGQSVYEVLNRESNLAVGIVGAAYLEACLGSLLEGYFIEGSETGRRLLSPGGKLESLGTRADLAYCLGLISKPLLDAVKKVAEIRNLLAHSHILLDFDHPDVIAACRKIQFLDILDKEQRLNGKEGLLTGFLVKASARDTFTLTVVFASNQIMLQGLGLERCQRNTAFVQAVSAKQDSSG